MLKDPRIPLFAANWKMNKSAAEVIPFVDRLSDRLAPSGGEYEVVVAPATLHLPALIVASAGKKIQAAAQNCGPAQSGAYTGEVAPAMLRELGCRWVILGHSERRQIFKENDALIQLRLKAALAEGLRPIVCVGEVLGDRQAGQTFSVVETQLSILKGLDLREVVVAYEPVWAIGTGETATPEQAQEVHAFIRQWVGRYFSGDHAGHVRVLYGGSVKPDNAEKLLAQTDIDGFLVGGASLDADVFAGVIENGLIGEKKK